MAGEFEPAVAHPPSRAAGVEAAHPALALDYYGVLPAARPRPTRARARRAAAPAGVALGGAYDDDGPGARGGGSG